MLDLKLNYFSAFFRRKMMKFSAHLSNFYYFYEFQCLTTFYKKFSRGHKFSFLFKVKFVSNFQNLSSLLQQRSKGNYYQIYSREISHFKFLTSLLFIIIKYFIQFWCANSFISVSRTNEVICTSVAIKKMKKRSSLKHILVFN